MRTQENQGMGTEIMNAVLVLSGGPLERLYRVELAAGRDDLIIACDAGYLLRAISEYGPTLR
jgi:hypothetical protein